MRYSWSWKWVFRGFVRVWTWLRNGVGFRKGIELWERIMSGERVKYEQKGMLYSVGDDPPHVMMCAYGVWVDVLNTKPFMVCSGC